MSDDSQSSEDSVESERRTDGAETVENGAERADHAADTADSQDGNGQMSHDRQTEARQSGETQVENQRSRERQPAERARADESGPPEAAEPTPTGRNAVSVENVERSFGTVDVLDDVSFHAPTDTVTAIVGPNGSGKTTLLRIVAGLLAPDSGSVVVAEGGERPVGYLPQEPTFRSTFTVGETVSFYDSLLGGRADVDDVLDEVGLLGVRDRRVDALSGGMRRLLGLGIALLGRPPLLVLDEPASGLDPKMRGHIFDVVADVVDEDTAVLLATHHLVDAQEADRLVVVDRGRIVARGTPAEVLETAGVDSLEDAFETLVSDELAVQTGTEGSR